MTCGIHEEIYLNKKIPQDFFLDETVCNYHISKTIKKVWAIEIDIAENIVNICKENNLRCWLAEGSLLGAVRHHGFIPWDDDMDLYLPRPDYEKLKIILERNCPEHLSLKPGGNGQGYAHPFLQVYNNNSTCIADRKNKLYAFGISVDVFPLDGLPKSKLLLKILIIKLTMIRKIRNSYELNESKHLLSRLLHRVLHWKIVGYNQSKLFTKANKIASRTTWEKAEKVGSIVLGYYDILKTQYHKSDFSRTKILPFNYTEFPVPSGYIDLLKTQYGDYLEFPPEAERGKHHLFRFEPDIPCDEYYKKYKELKQETKT